MHPKAAALLDAHVAFTLDRLTGKDLQHHVETLLNQMLEDASKLTLNDAVTRDMIKATALTYASEIEPHGAIPELIGDIARQLHAHAIQESTTPQNLISDRHVREVVGKALELKALRERLIHEAIGNPMYSAMASDLLFHGIKGYITQNNLAKSIPGAQGMMKLGMSVLNKAAAATGMDGGLEENLKKYIQKNIKVTLRESEKFLLHGLSEDKLNDVALDVWDQIKSQPISSSRPLLGAGDMEEFFVIGYEIWRELRKTDWYKAMIESGIDTFFDKYGDTTLRVLLDEVGVTREIMLGEAMRFAPPVLKMLKKKKLLEPLIRQQLAPFYESSIAEKLLSGTLEPAG